MRTSERRELAKAVDLVMDTRLSPQILDSRKILLDGNIENRFTKKPHYPVGMAAGLTMETCQSREIQDLRKGLLERDVGNLALGVAEKLHYRGGTEGTYHFKLLVPSVVAGAIIGKGGDTIAQLQKNTGARVKISKANDFYPGTLERVCLITGNVDAIMKVLTFIMEKNREKPDLKQASNFGNKISVERDKVKILVPNCTAGMIIGKAGNYIKQIKEESGSYIHVSQKDKDQTLEERCITVIGDMESNKAACLKILAKIVEDHQSGSYPNISYADVSGPIANYKPPGSPYTNDSSQQTPISTPFNNTANVDAPVPSGGLNSNAPSGGTSLTLQQLELIKMMLCRSGYSDQSTNEITAAITTLVQYGLLEMGLDLPAESDNTTSDSHPLVSAGSYDGDSLLESAPSPQTVNGEGNNGGVFDPIGTVSGRGSSSPMLPGYKGGTPGSSFYYFCQQSSPNNLDSPILQNCNSFALGTGQQESTISSLCKSPTSSEMNSEQEKIKLEISEKFVGAILGPRGRTLTEIEHVSGAIIQISNKGTFSPGTCNRIVNIFGSPVAINTAKYLIEQKVSEQEAKHTRQSSIGIPL